jgi:hypothetical protein
MDSDAQQAYIEERWKEIKADRDTAEEESKEVGVVCRKLRSKMEKIIVAHVPGPMLIQTKAAQT